MPHDVEMIRMGFHVYKKASIEEARELEVTVTEMLVDRINAHEKIRPFLREYPFTHEQVKVFIAFKQKDGASISDGSVAFINQARNNLYYCSNDPITDKYVDLYEEPYDEAVKILNEKALSKNLGSQNVQSHQNP